jgi:diaminohydroxyphosphoribosylaminopyrimidine deaminase/5-amino-6-(5-phosphoribosylamino)uracil reductase
MADPAEVAAMRRAIALSAAGIGTTSPNPPVGCVVLGPDGRVVGEGYHLRKGEAHAEAHALAAAGGLAEAATAVVTLEPCNHEGRTPACRQGLIDAKIARVVIAVLDPTSRGEGGAARLQAAGVDVEVGVLGAEARVVLGPWLTALEVRRPVTIWPYIIGADGIEAVTDAVGDMRRMRLNADAVLHPDGSVAEAVPGSHGAGMLRLDNFVRDADPAAMVGSLYQRGVRHLILAGGLDRAGPFLARGLIDRVYAYLPDDPVSCRPRGSQPWPQVPPGFTIVAAERIDGFVRIDAKASWLDSSGA